MSTALEVIAIGMSIAAAYGLFAWLIIKLCSANTACARREARMRVGSRLAERALAPSPQRVAGWEERPDAEPAQGARELRCWRHAA